MHLVNFGVGVLSIKLSPVLDIYQVNLIRKGINVYIEHALNKEVTVQWFWVQG